MNLASFLTSSATLSSLPSKHNYGERTSMTEYCRLRGGGENRPQPAEATQPLSCRILVVKWEWLTDVQMLL